MSKILTSKALAHKLWEKACKYDGIDPTSRVAAFSPKNPYRAAANRAAALLGKIWEGQKPKPLPR